MPTSSPFNEPLVPPGGRGPSIQQQLYDRVRSAVAAGRLQPGERLPSTRSLAALLHLARGTVDAAYSRLATDGYLVSRGAAGTMVSPRLRGPTSDVATLSRQAARPPPPVVLPTEPQAPLPFGGGLPALDLFPRVIWARLTARVARGLTAPDLCYPDPSGSPSLRRAIAAHLAVSRGVACDPSQVLITGGYQAGLRLVATLLLTAGAPVWFEDPGYTFARRALEAAGANLVPVPVDTDGLNLCWAMTQCPQARLAVVTPAHQSPLGVTLSLARRRQLLAWAAGADAWVLEDDYDSEFHYVGHKPPALKSIDEQDRVIYAGSFSKTLFPGLRIGYLVLPWRLLQSAITAGELAERGQNRLQQAVLSAWISEGHFARHLRRMRTRYQARRQALAEALNGQFGAAVSLVLPSGGLSLRAQFHGFGEDHELADRALAAGLAPTALSRLSIRHPAGQALLLGFTNIPEQRAAEMVARLARAIG